MPTQTLVCAEDEALLSDWAGAETLGASPDLSDVGPVFTNQITRAITIKTRAAEYIYLSFLVIFIVIDRLIINYSLSLAFLRIFVKCIKSPF